MLPILRLFFCVFLISIGVCVANTTSYAPLVKTTLPAVVGVYTTQKEEVETFPHPFGNDPFFQQFFENTPFNQTKPQVRITSGVGSGVIIKPEGIVITNYHVVKGATNIKISLSDAREFPAKIVGYDEATDLAVLKIAAQGISFPYLILGNSDELEIGDIILIIGNPYGFTHSVSQGIVSALARTQLHLKDYDYYIQTDAAINPGNSGGAMVNMQGELVGIPTAIFTSGDGGSLGIGWAIPSNLVKMVSDSLQKTGQVIRPSLGIAAKNLNSDIAQSLALPSNQGVLVTGVRRDSLAHTMGLKTGDIIVKINEDTIPDTTTMRYRLSLLNIGEEISLTLIRQRKTITLQGTIAKNATTTFPDVEAIEIRGGTSPLRGAWLALLTEQLAQEMGLEGGAGIVVLELIEESRASELGLKLGDIILEINGHPVTSLDMASKILHQTAPKTWHITVNRAGRVLQAVVGD